MDKGGRDRSVSLRIYLFSGLRRQEGIHESTIHDPPKSASLAPGDLLAIPRIEPKRPDGRHRMRKSADCGEFGSFRKGNGTFTQPNVSLLFDPLVVYADNRCGRGNEGSTRTAVQN